MCGAPGPAVTSGPCTHPFPVPRSTCTRGPSSCTSAWAGTSTCPPSSCSPSRPCTPSQVRRLRVAGEACGHAREPERLVGGRGPPPPTAWELASSCQAPGLLQLSLLAWLLCPQLTHPCKGRGRRCGTAVPPGALLTSLSLPRRGQGPSSSLVSTHRGPGRCDLHRCPANAHHGGGSRDPDGQR